MKIPKIVHYCWFGKKAMPKMLHYCFLSWKEQLPDYEFKLWNEENSSFDCEFVKLAYANKKWAFVSDYIRLKVVYEYGGVYLDTDMLLLKSLNDFLCFDSFFIAEHDKSIGMGIFGAKKHHPFVKKCLEYYILNENVPPIPKVVTDSFMEEFDLRNDFRNTIDLKTISIFSKNYFYALPFSQYFDIHNYKNYLTLESYGVHLWYGSWHNYSELVLLRRKEYGKAFRQILRTLSGGKGFERIYLRKVVIALKDGVLTKNAFK